MKKYLLAALILISQQALADFATNCTNNGGTIITANSYGNDKGGLCNDPNNPNLTNNCNGKRFCKGGNTMNWWSSFTWCEAIGGHLASFATVCPGAQTHTSGNCPNVKGINSGLGRTSTGWQGNATFYVNLASGAYEANDSYGLRSYTFPYPLCEE